MRTAVIFLGLVFCLSLATASADSLNLDANMAVWWRSSTKDRMDTALQVMNNAKGMGMLNYTGKGISEMAVELVVCAETATRGLEEINKSQSIGTILMLCCFQMGYISSPSR